MCWSKNQIFLLIFFPHFFWFLNPFPTFPSVSYPAQGMKLPRDAFFPIIFFFLSIKKIYFFLILHSFNSSFLWGLRIASRPSRTIPALWTINTFNKLNHRGNNSFFFGIMTEARSCLVLTFRKLNFDLDLPFRALFIPHLIRFVWIMGT